MAPVVTLRPMLAEDAAECVEIFGDAFTEMRTRFHLPITTWGPDDARREAERFRHFQASDPEGSWVAVAGDEIVGLTQAIVREGLWMLSMLAVRPGHQSAGVGASLLQAAMGYGDPGAPAMLLCSHDPRAVRRYVAAGFTLHPAMAATGAVDAAGLPPAGGIRPGDAGDLGMVAEIDRDVRGASRAADIGWLLASEAAQLFVADDEGWVALFRDRPYALAARSEDAARRLLSHALGQLGRGTVTDVGWLTASHQWAIEVALAARLDLHPVGPYFTRNLPGPFTPALACGAFG